MKTVFRRKGEHKVKADTMATQMPRSNAPIFKIKIKKRENQ